MVISYIKSKNSHYPYENYYPKFILIWRSLIYFKGYARNCSYL